MEDILTYEEKVDKSPIV